MQCIECTRSQNERSRLKYEQLFILASQCASSCVLVVCAFYFLSFSMNEAVFRRYVNFLRLFDWSEDPIRFESSLSFFYVRFCWFLLSSWNAWVNFRFSWVFHILTRCAVFVYQMHTHSAFTVHTQTHVFDMPSKFPWELVKWIKMTAAHRRHTTQTLTAKPLSNIA